MRFQFIFVATALSLALCGAALAQPAATPATVASHYADLAYANYEDTLNRARALQSAVNAFTAAPSQAKLDAARNAWLDAREVYGQTAASSSYISPMDDDKDLRHRLNAWPVDESHVDFVAGRRNAGLVNNRKLITKKFLSGLHKLNQKYDEEEVITGWHAIEFLLWGQDLSESGPGNRSFEDFVDGKTPNADRRRQYLQVVTELLIDDLDAVLKAWAPGTNHNYRAKFKRGDNESLWNIFRALFSLTGGLEVDLSSALVSQDQEDEQSDFSDNTHRDAVANAKGIENVWLGRYVRADASVVQGPSLRDLVASKDANLADQTTTQIRQSVQAAEAIPAPFDQAILQGSPGRAQIEATIKSLSAQFDQLVAVRTALGIRTRSCSSSPTTRKKGTCSHPPTSAQQTR